MERRNCDSGCGRLGEISCLCVSPPYQICGNCIPAHVFDQPGLHSQRPLPSLPSSHVCSLCKTAPAVIDCSCSRILTCEKCYQTHRNVGGKRHLKLPIVACRDSQKAKQAMTFFEVALNGLEDVRDAQTAAIKTMDGIIQQVQKYKVELLLDLSQQLTVLEIQANNAINEVLSYLSSPESSGSSPVLSLLSLSRDSLSSRLSFISITRSKSPNLQNEIAKSFSFLIHKERFSAQIAAEAIRVLPYFGERRVILSPEPFNFMYEADIDGMLSFFKFSAWCFLPNGNTIVTGSLNNQATLSVDCAGAYAIQLPNTLQVHYLPGIISVDNRVYLFGGRIEVDLRDAEVFDLLENKWIFLPSMTFPRSVFQPSFWQQAIYLFSSSLFGMSEKFCLKTHEYEKLSFRLPRGSNVSYCWEGTFFIFAQTEMYKWNQRDSPTVEKSGLSVGFFSQMSPVRIADQIFFYSFAENDCYLMKMELRSLRLEIAVQFEKEV